MKNGKRLGTATRHGTDAICSLDVHFGQVADIWRAAWIEDEIAGDACGGLELVSSYQGLFGKIVFTKMKMAFPSSSCSSRLSSQHFMEGHVRFGRRAVASPIPDDVEAS